MPDRKPLSIGVLTIGSLYWDERRKAWRDSRLNLGDSWNVPMRIRYGRLSTGRDNSYTMVFSGAAGIPPLNSRRPSVLVTV
jgi:hypothetical protein